MVQYIGVDVASETLEAGLSQQRKTRRFANTPDGITALRGWLEDIKVGADQQVILEPTITYHQHLVETLVQWGIPYNLINPAHTAAFARVQGRRPKTDPVDVHLLAAFGESQQPATSKDIPAMAPRKTTKVLVVSSRAWIVSCWLVMEKSSSPVIRWRCRSTVAISCTAPSIWSVPAIWTLIVWT